MTDLDLGIAELVIAELANNVVIHAPGPAEIALDLSGDAPTLHVLDRGAGFSFTRTKLPDHLQVGGRGLFIVSKVASGLSLGPRPGGGTHARAVLACSKPLTANGRPAELHERS